MPELESSICNLRCDAGPTCGRSSNVQNCPALPQKGGRVSRLSPPLFRVRDRLGCEVTSTHCNLSKAGPGSACVDRFNPRSGRLFAWRGQCALPNADDQRRSPSEVSKCAGRNSAHKHRRVQIASCRQTADGWNSRAGGLGNILASFLAASLSRHPANRMAHARDTSRDRTARICIAA